ncbi:MFSD5 protein, partial [Sakesphorus luctuosus]|nr:MFSD5 protein [Sakesphorus luctuosus]
PSFRTFQRQFQLGILPVLAADWLQGAHLFQLFRSGGFLHSQIAALYSLGFASNALCGVFSRSLVDRVGRRRSCVFSCLLCSLCCLLQHSRQFPALAAGRILGGVGTSLLFPSFESWYGHEHSERHDFPREWVPHAFARLALWNGGLAVGAGVVAELLVLLGGPTAPFAAAVPLQAASALFLLKNWDENYGKARGECGEGLRALRDPRRALLGAVQAVVEGILLIFIFLWTPVLDPLGIPLGIAFSGLMAASAVGSALSRRGAGR